MLDCFRVSSLLIHGQGTGFGEQAFNYLTAVCQVFKSFFFVRSIVLLYLVWAERVSSGPNKGQFVQSVLPQTSPKPANNTLGLAGLPKTFPSSSHTEQSI
jgi:hypothetical protein